MNDTKTRNIAATRLLLDLDELEAELLQAEAELLRIEMATVETRAMLEAL